MQNAVDDMHQNHVLKLFPVCTQTGWYKMFCLLNPTFTDSHLESVLFVYTKDDRMTLCI